MSYFPWTTDNHRMYVEVKSERIRSSGSGYYTYKYYISVYTYGSTSTWRDYFKLFFSCKADSLDFFRKFSSKFHAARNDRYNTELNKWEYTAISLEQIIEMMNQTIKELNYGKRKAEKLYKSMLSDF